MGIVLKLRETCNLSPSFFVNATERDLSIASVGESIVAWKGGLPNMWVWTARALCLDINGVVHAFGRLTWLHTCIADVPTNGHVITFWTETNDKDLPQNF